MPRVTPISKTDQALTGTAAGDILESSGPTGVPVVAVPGTDYSAPDADETLTGVKTYAKQQRIDWANGIWTNGIFQAISPPDAGVTPDFNWCFTTASPDKTPKDHILNIGWNMGEGGSPIDPNFPAWGIQFESSFFGNYSVTVPQSEWHLQHAGSTVIRSITATVLHDGSHCDIGFSGDETYFRNHTGTDEMTWAWPNMFIHNANAFTHATNNIRWLKQRMTTGVDASLIYLDGSNVVRIGESQVPAVRVAFASPVSEMILANPVDIQVRNNVGTVSSFINIDATNATIIRTPGNLYLANHSGNFTQLTSSGFNSYLRFDASGLMLGQSATSDGTQKIGFFGAAPIVKPSGELIAALTALGLVGSIDSIDLPGPITTTGRFGPIVANADADTITLDLDESDFHVVNLGGDRTIAITGTAPRNFTVKLIQDETGGWNPSWWSGITWWTVDGNKPTPVAGAGKGTYVQFVTTGPGEYDGILAAGQP